MRPFQDLQVWQLAHALTLDVWRASHAFPRDERFVLTPQIRRSAMSVPSNISEGCGLETMPQLRRYLGYASGSASELQYHLLLARDLGYLEQDQHQDLAQSLLSVRRLLTGFTQWTRTR